MIQKNWIITNYCKANIKQLGFIYDEKTDYWKYSFPVRYWKRRQTLRCDVFISRDKDHAWVNVFDSTNCIYPAFYTQEYGCYGEFVDIAEKKILYKLKSLGIIEKKEKKKYGHRKNNKSKVSHRRS